MMAVTGFSLPSPQIKRTSLRRTSHGQRFGHSVKQEEAKKDNQVSPPPKKAFCSSTRDIIICAITLIPCLLFPPLSPLFIGLSILTMWLLDKRAEEKSFKKTAQEAFLSGLG